MNVENRHKSSETTRHCKLTPTAQPAIGRLGKKARDMIGEIATDGQEMSLRDVAREGEGRKIGHTVETPTLETMAKIRSKAIEKAAEIVAATIPGMQGVTLAKSAMELSKVIAKEALKDCTDVGVKYGAETLIQASESDTLAKNKGAVKGLVQNASRQGLRLRSQLNEHRIPFDGLMHVENIADVQFGGTCWAEAIQKAIQLTLGDKDGIYNNLSTEIIAKVFNNPQAWDAIETANPKHECERWNIPTYRYVDMLKEFGIDAENRSFSHEELQIALNDRRPVLIGGDLKYLDGIYKKGNKGGHVLLAIDWEPDTGKYVLLDSNFNRVYKVSPKTLERFATGTWDDKILDSRVGNMTIIKTPSAWPDWKIYVDGKWAFYVDGRKVQDPFRQFEVFTKQRRDSVTFSGSKSIGFNGGCGISDMKYLRGESLISKGRQKFQEGKKNVGEELTREGNKLKAEAEKERQAARERERKRNSNH